MKAKHTKGKWEYTPDCLNKGTGFYIQTVDKSHRNSFIGDVGGGYQAKEEIEANAKLIAAAPELLEALIECVVAMKIVTSSAINPFIERAEKAIKKATK